MSYDYGFYSHKEKELIARVDQYGITAATGTEFPNDYILHACNDVNDAIAYGRKYRETQPGLREGLKLDHGIITSKLTITGVGVGVNTEEYTGGKTSYYEIEVVTIDGKRVTIDCDAVLMALKADFAIGNIIKAAWRFCAAMNLGKRKKGYDDGKYDIDKIVHYGKLKQEHRNGKETK